MSNPRVLFASWLVLCGMALSQTASQPRVAPGPDEPNWWDVLKDVYQLEMFADLVNPVNTTVSASPGLFRKAGPGTVTFEPVIALGTENPTHGGWYGAVGELVSPEKQELWVYADKHSAAEITSGQIRRLRLRSGSKTTFDPGDERFGLWVANDSFEGDGGVFSEPGLVARFNARLAPQPYKAMIYALRDQPHTYLIGWEYSTNDDFQDVVCILRNATLD